MHLREKRDTECKLSRAEIMAPLICVLVLELCEGDRRPLASWNSLRLGSQAARLLLLPF